MVKILWVVLGVTLIALLSGCGGDNFRDVEGVKSRNPDLIKVYNNVDRNPNITKVCIDGVAFATTTRDYNSVLRVPEWDKDCPGGTSR